MCLRLVTLHMRINTENVRLVDVVPAGLECYFEVRNLQESSTINKWRPINIQKGNEPNYFGEKRANSFFACSETDPLQKIAAQLLPPTAKKGAAPQKRGAASQTTAAARGEKNGITIYFTPWV